MSVLQPSSGASIISPPWEESSLQSYCDAINGNHGQRAKKYTELFRSLNDTITRREGPENFAALVSNFLIIAQKIPNGILNRETVKEVYTPLYQLIGANGSSITSIPRELPQKVEPNLEKEKECTFSSHKFESSSFVEHRYHSVGSQNTVSSPSTQELELTRRQNRTIYPILSIDGGGIRGIIPAKVLIEIEKITHEPIARLFKLVGGTSTGGILTLGLTKPCGSRSEPEYSARDLLSLYTNHCGDIFRQNPFYQKDTSELNIGETFNELIRNPQYNTPTLFQEKFGDSRLSSALTDVVITANTHEAVVSKLRNISMTTLTGLVSVGAGLLGYTPTHIWSDDRKEVHLFTNKGLQRLSYSLRALEKRYDCVAPRYSYPGSSPFEFYTETTDDFLMADIAKVTSAAPSYFSPILYNQKFFMDGGVLQNNPSIPCVLEALNRGHSNNSLFMLSLGTGVEPHHRPRTGLGSLLNLWFQTTQPHNQEDWTLRDMLGPKGIYRFQYTFKNDEFAPSLDDTEKITYLDNKGSELVEENSDQIVEVCAALRPDSR